MEEVIKIIMERDGYTRGEAEELVNEVVTCMEDCNFDASECESIFEEEIGLEPDYLINFLLDI